MTNALEALSAFESLIAGDSFADVSAFAKAEPIKTQEEIRIEWLLKRWGRCTASNYHKLMTCINKPDDLPAGAKTYLNKIIAELLTNPIDIDSGFVSSAMQWGIDHELEAIDNFLVRQGLNDDAVSCIGDSQVFNQFGEYFGGTPDGIFDGQPIEVKCPDSVTHLDYLEISNAATLNAIKPEYFWQIVGNCQALGAKKGWFISYDPRFKDAALRLHFAEIAIEPCDFGLLEKRQRLAEAYIEKRLQAFEALKNNN